MQCWNSGGCSLLFPSFAYLVPYYLGGLVYPRVYLSTIILLLVGAEEGGGTCVEDRPSLSKHQPRMKNLGRFLHLFLHPYSDEKGRTFFFSRACQANRKHCLGPSVRPMTLLRLPLKWRRVERSSSCEYSPFRIYADMS